MVDIGVAGEQNHIDVVPIAQVDFFLGGGEEVGKLNHLGFRIFDLGCRIWELGDDGFAFVIEKIVIQYGEFG